MSGVIIGREGREGGRGEEGEEWKVEYSGTSNKGHSEIGTTSTLVSTPC